MLDWDFKYSLSEAVAKVLNNSHQFRSVKQDNGWIRLEWKGQKIVVKFDTDNSK